MDTFNVAMEWLITNPQAISFAALATGTLLFIAVYATRNSISTDMRSGMVMVDGRPCYYYNSKGKRMDVLTSNAFDKVDADNVEEVQRVIDQNTAKLKRGEYWFRLEEINTALRNKADYENGYFVYLKAYPVDIDRQSAGVIYMIIAEPDAKYKRFPMCYSSEKEAVVALDMLKGVVNPWGYANCFVQDTGPFFDLS